MDKKKETESKETDENILNPRGEYEGPRRPAEQRGAARTTGELIWPSYPEFRDIWTNFSVDLGNRLVQNISTSQEEIRKFYDKWTKFSGDLGDKIKESASDEQYREMYDIWRNYVNKLENRLTRLANEGYNRYREVYDSWLKHSDSMQEQVTNVLNRKEVKTEKVYETWLGLSTTVRKQLDDVVEYYNREMDELSEAWTDLSTKMHDAILSMSQDESSAREIIDMWYSSLREFSDDVTEFLRDSSSNFISMQKVWTDYYTEMRKSMTELAKHIGLDYEDLYNRYFERTAHLQETFSPIWPRSTTALNREIEELKSRIKNLETQTSRKKNKPSKSE